MPLDLPLKWFPEHDNDGEICPLAQAKLYPYPAPDGDFVMQGGLPELRPDGIPPDELSGRTPVISVGSNRAPLQLRRKFGLKPRLPITACVLKDCDVGYAATLSFYCAAPATAFASAGTSVALNIVWLDDDQLHHMHDTEAVGIAYDYVCFDKGQIDHGKRPDDEVFEQAVYGYQSRAGLLGFNGKPIALKAIQATKRKTSAMTESEVLTQIKAIAGEKSCPLDDWLARLRADRIKRQGVMEQIAEYALPEPPITPWQVIPTTAKNPDQYL